MSLIVRGMRADELEACAALYDRVVAATFTWLDPGDSVAAFRHAASEETVFVAEQDARILGLAAFYPPDDFLHSLYVDAGSQGRGVGLALLRRVDEVASTPITLKVQVLNFGARRFYAREGFLELDEGGEDLPANDRWLRLGRWAAPGAPSPMPKLEIREATLTELDLCAALYERVAARHFTWEPAEVRTAGSKRDSFEGEEVLVALEHGVLAGFVSAERADVHVHSLFVEPQGWGTGPILLAAMLTRLGRPFTLDCDLRNLAGLRFYQRLGFMREGGVLAHGHAMARLCSPDRIEA